MNRLTEQCRDVIIIGAGLAGLGAANALRDRDTLVVEKEYAHGGRVLTREQAGICYDMGAVFAFDPALLPQNAVTPQLIEERGMIGAYWDGHTSFGNNVVDCLLKIAFHGDEISQLASFVESGGSDLTVMSQPVYRLLNSFFQLIHPGDMADYLPQRRLDAFLTFACGRYDTGNGALVEGYARDVIPFIHYGTNVVNMREADDEVIVTVDEQGIEKQLRAKVVICATPGPVTARLLSQTSLDRSNFLNRVQYGHGCVTVLAIPEHTLSEFQYIATPELATTTIVCQRTTAQGTVLLYLYYMGDKSIAESHLTSAQKVALALDTVNALGIGTVGRSEVLFADHQHWDLLSPIISDHSYGDWDDNNIHHSARLLLAGDYTYVNGSHLMPYGMAAALRSGQRAAATASRILGNLQPHHEVPVR